MMRILFEVPLKNSNQSSFTWLNVVENWLFIIEDGRKFKTIGTVDKPGSELSSSTLTEDKICTSLSWNFNSTILALVFDRNQVWLWKIKSNDSIHYKPNQSRLSSTEKTVNKRIKSREIELVEWSRISNKLAICYSTGQILLCDFDTPSPREILIDNTYGVLNPISSIHSSEHLDHFICQTTSHELLIMSYDGSFRFYLPSDNSSTTLAELASPSTRWLGESIEKNTRCEQSTWLAYRRGTSTLVLKNLKFIQDSSIESKDNIDDLIYEEEAGIKLVNFHWLSSRHILACYSTGLVTILELECNNKQEMSRFNLKSKRVLSISVEVNEENQLNNDRESFEAFQLREDNSEANLLDRSKSLCKKFSFAAMTSYKLFYYEISADDDSETGYSIERVDELDMSVSLQKLKLKLERVEWSLDCSMLAVQLTNSHVLVYRTKLQDYKVVSYGSRIAYMSEAKEVTILDYGFSQTYESNGICLGSDTDSGENQASIVNLSLKPTVIAIGSKHLAVGLNNRVHFYLLTSKDRKGEQLGGALLIDEQEYVSVVTNLLLNSHYAAVNFADGRLKLHPIQYNLANLDKDQNVSQHTDEEDGQFFDSLDERFFPDPLKDETISSFALTEQLFVYCTRQCKLIVFSLKDWAIVQCCDHQEIFAEPIIKLKPNDRGNKIVCLLGNVAYGKGDSVYLYDLYYNSMIILFDTTLYRRMFKSQLSLPSEYLSVIEEPKVEPTAKLNRIDDAIWDTDGKGLLLIESRRVHCCVVVAHTLEREEISVEYVATIEKASSYTTLYASHGIVSFQTNLGRVINSVLEPHDDELQLARLKQQIQEAKKGAASNNSLDLQAQIVRLKLDYLRVAMLINSLQKSQDICSQLMVDNDYNCCGITERSKQIDLVIWKQLAAWSLYTQNLQFALLLYKKQSLIVNAHVLSDILEDARCWYLDSKSAVKDRLMLMLGCQDIVGVD